MSQWIDISVTLQTGMAHWPGDPPVAVDRALSMERGESANLSILNMSAHTGTHMDAPLHFVSTGKSIDQMPFEVTIGPARVLDVSHEVISASCLGKYSIKAGERLLFKTRNSNLPRRYQRCFL